MKTQTIWTKDKHHLRNKSIGSIRKSAIGNYKVLKIELISDRRTEEFSTEKLRKIESEIREILMNNNLIIGGNKRNYIEK